MGLVRVHGFEIAKSESWENAVLKDNLIHSGVTATIALLNELLEFRSCGKFLNFLWFVDTMICWAMENRLSKEEHIAIFDFALSLPCNLSTFVVWDMTRYLEGIFTKKKYDLSLSEDKIALFFEKIKDHQDAYPFLYALCEHTIKLVPHVPLRFTRG